MRMYAWYAGNIHSLSSTWYLNENCSRGSPTCKHIKEWECDIPSYRKNIITYDPLPDSDKGTLPLQRLNSTHPHLRPTIKRGLFDNPNAHLPGEQPCKDFEQDDLLELFGYDEERGCSRIELEQGTEIDISIEDEQGVTSWILGKVSICHEGSLDFRAEFPGVA